MEVRPASFGDITLFRDAESSITSPNDFRGRGLRDFISPKIDEG